jgi:hypothetical protein
MSWIPLGIDGVFFLSLATILAGSFGLSVRYCLKSKCEHFGLCFGLITIDRRVDLEVQEHIRELEMGVPEEEEKHDKDTYQKSIKRPSLSSIPEEKNNI